MPYNYEAAPAYKSTRHGPTRQATYLPSDQYHTYPSIAVQSPQDSTRERWHAAQSPTIHTPLSTRPKGVRFASNDSSHLQPNAHGYRSDTPMSHASYGSAGSAPSLSHSADGEHEDDIKCPPTPEFRPASLAPEEPYAARSPLHTASYAAIDQIVRELDACAQSFQHPRDIDFEPTSGSTPKLAYTAKNRPVFEQTQRLEKLQGRLDAVESYGDKSVRRARKEAVTMIERELEGMKRIQARIWSKVRYT